MAERHKFLSQPGDDPLGAAVEFGGNRLHQRSYLRNLHEMDFLRPPTVFAEPASNAKRELIRFAKRRTRAAVPRKPIWDVVRCSTVDRRATTLQNVTIGELGVTNLQHLGITV